MIFIPLILGIVIGIIILLVSISMRKNNKPTVARIPGYIGVIAAIVLFIVGYAVVRGFEGAAYSMVAIPILIFAIISFFGKSSNNKSHQY